MALTGKTAKKTPPAELQSALERVFPDPEERKDALDESGGALQALLDHIENLRGHIQVQDEEIDLGEKLLSAAFSFVFPKQQDKSAALDAANEAAAANENFDEDKINGGATGGALGALVWRCQQLQQEIQQLRQEKQQIQQEKQQIQPEQQVAPEQQKKQLKRPAAYSDEEEERSVKKAKSRLGVQVS